MSPRTSPLTGDRVRVYRTVPARVIGWVMVAGAAVLSGLTVVDLASGTGGGLAWPVALVVAVAAAAWALFLRPHVELRTDGVVLANIVTDTTVPFAVVDEVTDRWALELDVDGRRYSSWAVPVRREWRTRTAVDDFAETTRRRGSGGMSAQGVADEVQRALQRWRLDGGELRSAPTGQEPRVTQRISWSSAVVLGCAVALLALALLS